VANGTERLDVSFTAPSSKPVPVAVEHHGKTVTRRCSGWMQCLRRLTRSQSVARN
jgi:hypothetical protein